MNIEKQLRNIKTKRRGYPISNDCKLSTGYPQRAEPRREVMGLTTNQDKDFFDSERQVGELIDDSDTIVILALDGKDDGHMRMFTAGDDKVVLFLFALWLWHKSKSTGIPADVLEDAIHMVIDDVEKKKKIRIEVDQ